MRFCCIIALVTFSLGFILGNAGTKVPKDALTQQRLFLLEKEIRNYYVLHKRLPGLLKELITESYPVHIVDAWNNPIEYRMNNHTNAMLISHGKPLYGIIYTLTKEICINDGSQSTQIVE